VKKRLFDVDGYPCSPTYLEEEAWYYVQKDGLVICTSWKWKPGEAVTVRWRTIKRALADHEAAKERKS
jgi:hypothetical protein